MFGPGKDLVDKMEKLSKTPLVCPKCRASFTFEDGLLCAKKAFETGRIRAKENGIHGGGVLMCHKCKSIYSSDGVLTSQKLTVDVTNKYSSLAPKKLLAMAAAKQLSPEEEALSAAKSKAANKKLIIILGIVLAVILLFSFLCVTLTSTQKPMTILTFTQTSKATLTATPTQTNTTFTLDVDALASTWFDTGISIQKSDEIKIETSGTIDFGGVQSGPDGNPDIQPGYGVVPTAPYGALVGMIGSREPFIVGSYYQQTALNDGNLKLIINDVPEQYTDNSGHFTVTITITKGK